MKNQRQHQKGFELIIRQSMVKLPSQSDRKVLILAFDGKYRPGARGNRDAEFMVRTIKKELKVHAPYGLILDFRRLHYIYGDMMDGVLQVSEDTWLGETCPTSVVTSYLNRNGLSTLVVDVMGDTIARWLFYTIDEALAEIDQRHLARDD